MRENGRAAHGLVVALILLAVARPAMQGPSVTASNSSEHSVSATAVFTPYDECLRGTAVVNAEMRSKSANVTNQPTGGSVNFIVTLYDDCASQYYFGGNGRRDLSPGQLIVDRSLG